MQEDGSCGVLAKAASDVPHEEEETENYTYSSIANVQEDLYLIPKPWCVILDSICTIKLAIVRNGNVEREVVIENDYQDKVQASVRIMGIPAPKLRTKFRDQTLRTFLLKLIDMGVCEGVTSSDLQELAGLLEASASTKQYFRHVVNDIDKDFCQKSCVRARDCDLLINGGCICKQCSATEKLLRQRLHRRENRTLDDVHVNDPLHGFTRQQLKDGFKAQRAQNKRLQQEIKDKLEKESVDLSPKMHNDLLQDLDASKIEEPLAKLFWEQQVRAFGNKQRATKWHPMMIRLAILLHCKSPGAYETLRRTGVLRLPGTSTLQEYTSALKTSQGFQGHVQEELLKAANNLEESKRFVCLLHDEMSIKSDLVFDKQTGELIGFVRSDDALNLHAPENRLATQALVFYLVGINSNIKMSLGYFGTTSATADELYPLFWEAVAFVEAVGLKVVVSTSDKAPQNQKLYLMHGQAGKVCYRTQNVFADDERFIYFMSDVPHLIKTIRNNLANSGCGKNTKLLWNNGHYLLWEHIVQLHKKDMDNGLCLLPRVRRDHLHLTAHSVMNVRLAAQVLSYSVGSVMQHHGGVEARETAKFILLMDRFFDCLNSRHWGEAEQRKKPDLAPYVDVNDGRFLFLQVEFLQYIEEWRMSTENRPGDFSKAARQKMFLTHQTYKGLVMTVNAFVEVCQYLLQNGVQFVLSNKLCQDPLEEHFGRHRYMGRTADNPNLQQFGHQENRLRLQRSLSLMISPKGNVKGTTDKRQPQVTVSPLNKKRY